MALSRKKADKQAATERLREWLKDGDTLWFILRHRSASGMQRTYSVKQLEVDTSSGSSLRVGDRNVVRASDLSSNIAMACGFGFADGAHYGVKVNGCGFSGEQDIADSVGSLLGINLRYETL